MFELLIVSVVAIILCAILIYVLIRLKQAKKETQIRIEAERDAGRTRVLPIGMLIAKSGSHRGMVFAIEPSGFKIGRDKDKNNLVIDSEIVSREHAWIGLENGLVVIRDLDSRNGTYINSLDGARIRVSELKDGDVIFIGKNGVESFKYKAG